MLKGLIGDIENADYCLPRAKDGTPYPLTGDKPTAWSMMSLQRFSCKLAYRMIAVSLYRNLIPKRPSTAQQHVLPCASQLSCKGSRCCNRSVGRCLQRSRSLCLCVIRYCQSSISSEANDNTCRDWCIWNRRVHCDVWRGLPEICY